MFLLAQIKDKKILIFGGTGSLGRALVERLASNNKLILFSRDEAKHWTIRNQLNYEQSVDFIVGDIRDRLRVEEVILETNPDYIIIASALKQVDTCENSPSESIYTNILGINNIAQSVVKLNSNLSDIKAVLMVSTDKACAPTNVYGMCKAVAERIITSKSLNHKHPKFIGVRYGNVLESRGSIIPLFRYQSDNNDFLTVTHADMTRFIMTLDESIDLIEATLVNAGSGEIWLPKLNSMRILDLATIFSDLYKKPIKIVGIRPGEKLHEDLINSTESIRVLDQDGYFKMMSVHHEINFEAEQFFYSSNQNVLSKDQLYKYLDDLGIFDRSIDKFIGKQIEEIKIK